MNLDSIYKQNPKFRVLGFKTEDKKRYSWDFKCTTDNNIKVKTSVLRYINAYVGLITQMSSSKNKESLD